MAKGVLKVTLNAPAGHGPPPRPTSGGPPLAADRPPAAPASDLPHLGPKTLRSSRGRRAWAWDVRARGDARRRGPVPPDTRASTQQDLQPGRALRRNHPTGRPSTSPRPRIRRRRSFESHRTPTTYTPSALEYGSGSGPVQGGASPGGEAQLGMTRAVGGASRAKGAGDAHLDAGLGLPRKGGPGERPPPASPPLPVGPSPPRPGPSRKALPRAPRPAPSAIPSRLPALSGTPPRTHPASATPTPFPALALPGRLRLAASPRPFRPVPRPRHPAQYPAPAPPRIGPPGEAPP